MARLYIRHEPIPGVVVTPGPDVKFHKDEEVKKYFNLAAAEISEEELSHICFVYKGKCWAARSKTFYSSGRMTSVLCAPFNDDPSGKLMLLKDTLLG